MSCVFVCGPAGSGKSSFCAALQQHAATLSRRIEVVNLDPAAESIAYEPALDVRELVSLEDVTLNSDFGPNGGLVYCIDYLTTNPEWLREGLEDMRDSYILIDMPGQIELYTHYTHVNSLAKMLENEGFNLCCIYMLDSRFVVDTATFLSATLMAMTVQINLSLPHFNCLTKMDIIKRDNLVRKRHIDMFLNADTEFLMASMKKNETGKLKALTEAICEVLNDFSLVRFHPVSVNDADLLQDFLMLLDNVLQYGEDEDAEPNDEYMDAPDE